MLTTIRRQEGFTLVEQLLVIMILGIQGWVVMQHLGKTQEINPIQPVKTQLASFETALERYKLDHGVYPGDDQGLNALSDPSAEEVYLRYIPKDPWGNEYQYAQRSARGNLDYDVWSLGPDGQDGSDDDIGNWPDESGAV